MTNDEKCYYHWTCGHGYAGITKTGLLYPAAQFSQNPLPWPADFAWMSDLKYPHEEGLGLTTRISGCNRKEYRFRIPDSEHIVHWPKVARTLGKEAREYLENSPGAMPMHWYVTQTAIPAIYDPITKE